SFPTRRSSDLDLLALADLDLLAERDLPVPGQVDRQRTRRRAGRRILGDAEAGGEHPGLPHGVAAGETVHAEIVVEGGQFRPVRGQLGHLALIAKPDVDVARAVAVLL